jgi:hypothetical protein
MMGGRALEFSDREGDEEHEAQQGGRVADRNGPTDETAVDPDLGPEKNSG